MVIILNGNLSQRHNGLGRTLGIASVTRESCHARFNDNCLSGIRIFDTSCTQNRQCCRDILIRKLGIRGIVGIALSIASELLTRQARRDRNLRVVLRLRNLQVLGCDNGAATRLKKTPILPGHRVIARQIHRNNTKGRRIGRRLVIAPGKVAVGIEICLLERVHVRRNGIGVLAIQNGGSIAGLRLFHKSKLGIKLVLVLWGNCKVEGLACRDLGVRLIGHRKGDLGLCCLGARQRLIDRALIAVKRDVIGAGGVLDLEVLAIDIKRARARHLQVGGQAVLIGNVLGAGVLDVVVGKRRIDLCLQVGLVGCNLIGVALDSNGMRGPTGHLDIGDVRQHRDFGGQRDLAVARLARNLARVVVPAVARNRQGIGIGARPLDGELLVGARPVRQRQILGNALGGIARGIADGKLLGGVVDQVLKLAFVPSDFNGFSRLVFNRLAIARELERNARATQLVNAVAARRVGIEIEERDIAVSLIVRRGDADLSALIRRAEAGGLSLNVDIIKAELLELSLQRVVDVTAISTVGDANQRVFIAELLNSSLERTGLDDLVGRDDLDLGRATRSNSLKVLVTGRIGNLDLGTRYFELSPIIIRRIGGVGRIPRDIGAVGRKLNAVSGRAVDALSVHIGRDAIARDKVGRLALELRRAHDAQQVILPRRQHRVPRGPRNGVVERRGLELEGLAHKRIGDSQRTGGGVKVIGDLGPISVIGALGIPGDGQLGVLGQGRIGQARGTGDTDLGRQRRAHIERGARGLSGLNGLERVLAGKRHRAHGVDRGCAAVVVLLLRALDRVFTRSNHTDVLAHQGARYRIGRRVGSTVDILERAFGGGLGIGILPLVMDRIGRADTRRGVALGRLSREHVAHMHGPSRRSALDRNAVQLDRADL